MSEGILSNTTTTTSRTLDDLTAEDVLDTMRTWADRLRALPPQLRIVRKGALPAGMIVHDEKHPDGPVIYVAPDVLDALPRREWQPGVGLFGIPIEEE